MHLLKKKKKILPSSFWRLCMRRIIWSLFVYFSVLSLLPWKIFYSLLFCSKRACSQWGWKTIASVVWGALLTWACISCRGINSWCTINSRAPSLQKLSDFRPDTRGRVVNVISWLWSCYITKENGWLSVTSEHTTITAVMSLYRDSVMNRGKYNIIYLSK